MRKFDLRWVFRDTNGSALSLFNSAGDELQFDLTGVYGERLDDPLYHHADLTQLTEPWDLSGLHGSEPDRKLGVVRHGVRHAALGDGRWLQPEPLLYMGAPLGDRDLRLILVPTGTSPTRPQPDF